ncbi:MAG TPA: FAD-binding protein, partial [Mycobacterium sp.]
MTYDADLLIVGGGPAGLASAINARLQGLSVIVAEPRSDPIDKA